MNHIYLILTHKNPGQLFRLISRIRYPDTLFVVHVDASMELKDFLFIKEEIGDDIIFLEKRFRTRWGSFALVEATLSGLRFITDEFPETDRVTLLSGQDYPIKPVKQINAYLKANKDVIFIDHFTIPARHWTNGGIGRFPNYERVSKIMKLYGGSQWWSLPIYAIKLIFSILENYPHILNYFRMAGIPDESFFQTILLNSEEEVILKNIVSESLKLVWWDVPYNSPRIFVEADIDLLSQSKKLFARKFDTKIDFEVLDSIDKTLLDEKKYRKVRKEENVKNTRHKKQAVAMLTDDLSCLPGYLKLKAELPAEYAPHLLFQNKHNINLDAIATESVFEFDNSILENPGCGPVGSGMLPENKHTPLLRFYQENQDYDYYWLIEGNVYYNGKWNDFFRDFSSKKSRVDFISSYLRTKIQEPNWHCWNSLKHPDFLHNPQLSYIASFNPVYRISNRALKFLCEQVSKGWNGHHEVLMPTLLYNAGFTILDFGGAGNFCFPQNKNRYYSVSRLSRNGKYWPGSIRSHPDINVEEIRNKLLYYPVKRNMKKE